jgi:hypothetical protein
LGISHLISELDLFLVSDDPLVVWRSPEKYYTSNNGEVSKLTFDNPSKSGESKKMSFRSLFLIREVVFFQEKVI